MAKRFIVHVKTRAPGAKVERMDEGQYKVWVIAAPERGKANEEVIEALASHFDVPKSSIRIIIGKTAREKLIEIG